MGDSIQTLDPQSLTHLSHDLVDVENQRIAALNRWHAAGSPTAVLAHVGPPIFRTCLVTPANGYMFARNRSRAGVQVEATDLAALPATDPIRCRGQSSLTGSRKRR
jgi:hypothetical protein